MFYVAVAYFTDCGLIINACNCPNGWDCFFLYTTRKLMENHFSNTSLHVFTVQIYLNYINLIWDISCFRIRNGLCREHILQINATHENIT